MGSARCTVLPTGTVVIQFEAQPPGTRQTVVVTNSEMPWVLETV